MWSGWAEGREREGRKAGSEVAGARRERERGAEGDYFTVGAVPVT